MVISIFTSKGKPTRERVRIHTSIIVPRMTREYTIPSSADQLQNSKSLNADLSLPEITRRKREKQRVKVLRMKNNAEHRLQLKRWGRYAIYRKLETKPSNRG